MSGYQDWLRAGRPWNTAQPIAELSRVLRTAGYTVYVLGDDSHLKSGTPEDHAPFSATGWPVASPRWWVHACDIMPGGGPLTLAQLGAQLAKDKDAGVAPWIKYMNWTPQGQGCQHWSWEPGRNIKPSSDTGHIHLSIRSDATHSSINGYDPIARFRAGGGSVTPVVVTPGTTAPPWPGRYFKYTPGQPMVHGDDVKQWQQRIRDRGWSAMQADGWYGAGSAGICLAFQREKRLTADQIVGRDTWRAAWEAPVT